MAVQSLLSRGKVKWLHNPKVSGRNSSDKRPCHLGETEMATPLLLSKSEMKWLHNLITWSISRRNQSGYIPTISRPQCRECERETLFRLKIKKNQKIHDFRPNKRGGGHFFNIFDPPPTPQKPKKVGFKWGV